MSSEALRLADELQQAHQGHSDEGPSTFSEAASLLREQATARALDTFAHNVLAGQARLQMVHLENKLQNVIAERDTLRAEVERLRKPLTDEQIEALPVWSRFVGLWPETRKDIARAIEAAKEAA